MLTTHYMDEAEALSDRVGIINDGRMLAIDSVASLRNAHDLEFKTTFQSSDGETDTIYDGTSHELSERLRDQGVEEFTIARANLEDVYLALTGKGIPAYWIDRRLSGLAGPDYDATISFGLPLEPEDSQYGKSRLLCLPLPPQAGQRDLQDPQAQRQVLREAHRR